MPCDLSTDVLAAPAQDEGGAAALDEAVGAVLGSLPRAMVPGQFGA